MRLPESFQTFTPFSRPRAASLSALVFVLVAAVALGGCGQGGGSARDGDEASGETGSVSIFLTDAPGDEFDQILIDIEGITLIGGGPQVEIFDGSVTVDLLDLENFSDLFVHADEVPARDYTKVRLHVSRIRLVREGDDGEVIEVDPPANGKIDLLAAPDKITVRPGIDCVIEIDVDAKESIHRSGNGRYRFRPVVKIDVRDTIPPRKLARVHGTIRRVFDDRNFVLCPTLFMASRDVLESRERVADGGLGDRRRCMTVELDDRTGVFDQNGDPAPGDELETGDRVTVVGRFHLVDRTHDHSDEVDPMDDMGEEESEELAASSALVIEGDFEHRRHYFEDDGEDDLPNDDDDDDHKPRPFPVRLVLLAFVVEEGPPGTFLRLKGTVLSAVHQGGDFDFAIAPGQGFGSDSETTAIVQEGTRIFSRRGREVHPDALAPDLLALIDGVFAFEAGGSSLFKTALIMLNLVPPMPDVVSGEIEDIAPAQRRLFVNVATDSELSEAPDYINACVDVLEDARIWIIRERAELTSSGGASFEDLEIGMHVRATGTYGENDCLQARSIVAFDPGPPVVECSENGECDRSQYCARPEGQCDERGVCTVRPQVCPLAFIPVCGCDGRTYDNACDAAYHGVSIAHDGRCEPEPIICGGFPGTPCPDGMLCQYRDGECNIADNTGVCVDEPQGCPEIYQPVCGCDGETYSNRCEALVAGARIDHEGRCEPRRCGGIAGFECDEGEICVFESGQCISDAMGWCEPDPGGCPRIYAPVCGCDGVTYSNECEARRAEVAIQHRGVCEDTRDCGGELDVVCSEGHFCQGEVGDCRENAPGQCTLRPEACLQVWLPVCGCDGRTYSNGCMATAAGVTIARLGTCEDPCDATTGIRPPYCDVLPPDEYPNAHVEVLQHAM